MHDPSTWTPRCRPPKGLFRPVHLDPTGATGPTRGQARGKTWRQSSRGCYVPSHVDPAMPEQRILEAAALLPRCGAVTGWASLRWRGAAYFDGLEADGRTMRPVPLAVGTRHDLRDRPLVRVMRDRLEPSDVTSVRGTPCTTAERATFDAMRSAENLEEAVVSMDMAAAAELTSIRRMRRYCEGRSRWNGLPQVLAALDLSDENSRSPNETRTRWIWVVEAKLPRPLSNQPVFDRSGRLLGIADLLDPVAGVVGEYDGAAHRSLSRHRRDVLREDLFRRVGLEYFKVVGPDLRDVGLVVERMITTRARAKFERPDVRAWTLVPPPGWLESPLEMASLDERLDYTAWLRGQEQDGQERVG